MHKNMLKSNQTAENLQKQPHHHNTEDSDTLHMGVAVPLTTEDLEKELISKPIDTSTQKDGISTWILLSGGQNSKISPTTVTPIKSSIRYESKIEKVTKMKPTISTTIKPKDKIKVSMTTTTTTAPTINDIKQVELIDSNKLKINQKNNQIKLKTTIQPEILSKSGTIQPEIGSKKDLNKKVTRSVLRSTKLTTTMPTKILIEPSTKNPIIHVAGTPTTIAPVVITTPETNVESNYIESTTFLIMEPKDAGFDLPQDRSPDTTKKPKKTKKNKPKDSKKPGKTDVANKEKPLSTKLYNYFAREVMPTVGVGLVGLTVAAGLATYFLGPFAALRLRRSDEDDADRKDDMYYYNNEEYAGPDGQLEEEAFGKVIAGMPINSPYRNSIRYTVQQQPSQLRQPNQIQNLRPGAKYVHYPPPPSPQYRVRNVAPAGYQAVVQQQQYGSYQQQANHQSNPVYTKRRDPYPQQFYRYNDEPSLGMYRKNSNYEFVQQHQQQPQHQQQSQQQQQPQQQQTQQQQQQMQTSSPQQIDAQKSDDKTYDVENSYNPTIVTAEPYFDNTGGGDMKIVDDNVLSKRTQFVVGTTIDDDDNKSQSTNNEEIIKETVDVIPEHGPRKRRRRDIYNQGDSILESMNEVDGVMLDEVSATITDQSTPDTTMNIILKTEPNLIKTTTIKPHTTTIKAPTKPNIIELIKELVQVKVRMGLSFLQRTTIAVQKYLKSIEKRVEESKIFQSKTKKN